MKKGKAKMQDLLSTVDSQYKLVVMAAKRVKMLSHGAQPLVTVKGLSLIETALAEISAGKITFEKE